MLDCIEATDPIQAAPLRYLTPHPAAWKNYQWCPWASSVLVTDHETGDLMLVPVNCKRWGCEWCAIRKIRRLAFLTTGARPNRMFTFTFPPHLFESPKEAWEKTTDAVPEVCRYVRNTRGECEYLRVTELHKTGWPHFHCLVRSSFVPQKQLADEWTRLVRKQSTRDEAPTDDPAELKRRRLPFRVDVRKVMSTFSSFRYLVKYLTKLHKIEWTDRHVSYSRNFFREEDKERPLYPERAIESKTDEHPWLYISRRYPTDTIGIDPNGSFHLPYDYCGTPMDLTRRDVGLPPLPAKEEPKPQPKTQLAMLADQAEPNYADVSF